MKPHLHARGSVKRWGGRPEDYLPIHDLIDSSKIAMPDLRHRAVLHNAFGCFLVERVFGHTITNSDGRVVSVRDVAEAHVVEDLGFLPSLEDFLDELPQSAWHGGIHRMLKEQRPPLPAEVREQRRLRVRAVFDEHIGLSEFSPSADLVDAIIHAVRGVPDEHEED